MDHLGRGEEGYRMSPDRMDQRLSRRVPACEFRPRARRLQALLTAPHSTKQAASEPWNLSRKPSTRSPTY